MSEKKAPAANSVTWLIVFLFGLSFLIAGISEGVYDARVKADYAVADGTVIGRTESQMAVAYTVDNQMCVVRLNENPGNWKLHQKVKVYYDPESPQSILREYLPLRPFFIPAGGIIMLCALAKKKEDIRKKRQRFGLEKRGKLVKAVAREYEVDLTKRNGSVYGSIFKLIDENGTWYVSDSVLAENPNSWIGKEYDVFVDPKDPKIYVVRMLEHVMGEMVPDRHAEEKAPEKGPEEKQEQAGTKDAEHVD